MPARPLGVPWPQAACLSHAKIVLLHEIDTTPGGQSKELLLRP